MHIVLLLANLTSSDNNYDVKSCTENLKYLNELWDKCSESKKRKYKGSFDAVREVIEGSLEYYKKQEENGNN